MGIITRRNGRFTWDDKTPRLDENGESAVYLDIKITGPTDDDGITPIIVVGISHAASGAFKELNIPGYIECENEEFWYLERVISYGKLSTYSQYPADGEILDDWVLMAEDPSEEIYLEGCELHIASPIRAFTYNEIYGSYR